MIRLAAECDDVPTEVIDTVRKLLERSGRYIRRVRCHRLSRMLLLIGNYSAVISLLICPYTKELFETSFHRRDLLL